MLKAAKKESWDQNFNNNNTIKSSEANLLNLKPFAES